MREDEEAKIIDALAVNFYEVVPVEYQTHCVLTARIACQTLAALGVEAELKSCQIWYVTPNHNYVIGFLGHPPTQGKWDGHVMCKTKFHFIDAATHHFKREFGLDAPRTVAGKLFQVPSHVISRTDLGPDKRMWWHEPPDGADAAPPEVPPELVWQHVQRLVERLKA